MTDHEGKRKIYLAWGTQGAWKQLAIAWGKAKGNNQLFLGPRARWIFLLAEGSAIICFIISLYAYCA